MMSPMSKSGRDVVPEVRLHPPQSLRPLPPYHCFAGRQSTGSAEALRAAAGCQRPRVGRRFCTRVVVPRPLLAGPSYHSAGKMASVRGTRFFQEGPEIESPTWRRCGDGGGDCKRGCCGDWCAGSVTDRPCTAWPLRIRPEGPTDDPVYEMSSAKERSMSAPRAPC